MNNINDRLKSFNFYISNDYKIRVYEMDKSWAETRVFEYLISTQQIKTYTGQTNIETLWTEKDIPNSNKTGQSWKLISVEEALKYPCFKEVFLTTINAN